MKRSSFKMIFFALKISRGGECCMPAALLFRICAYVTCTKFSCAGTFYHKATQISGTEAYTNESKMELSITGKNETPIVKRVFFLRDRQCLYKPSVFLVRPSRGGPVPLFPRNKLTYSPVPQKSKICYLIFPVPQYCLCSPVPLKIWPFFPCSPEINALFPLFPKTHGRASLVGFI